MFLSFLLPFQPSFFFKNLTVFQTLTPTYISKKKQFRSKTFGRPKNVLSLKNFSLEHLKYSTEIKFQPKNFQNPILD